MNREPKIRVLLIDVNCKYSSTGKIVYDLYTQLNTDGHTAAVAYGRGSIIQEKNIYRFSPKWEVYLHALLTRITGYTGCFSYIATRRLQRFIEKFKPDVVHLNDMHGYFVNIIPLMEYLKKKDIKTVWTFHCEFMYTGKCGCSYECDKWKKECGNCTHLKDYPQSLFWDHTRSMYMSKKKAFEDFEHLTIVAPSKWLAARIERSFLRDRKVITVYNGIDTEIFHKRDTTELKKKLGLTDEKIVLAVAPNILSRPKGGMHVLQIAHIMRGQNIKFILVGVADLNQKYDDNVLTIGLIKNQVLLAEYYSLADVFVICSEQESYPTTCLEASACGVPIVGYDVGGISETTISGRGIFVPFGHLEKLQKGIEHFLYDFDDLDIDNKSVIKDYSKKRMYKDYFEIYIQ